MRIQRWQVGVYGLMAAALALAIGISMLSGRLGERPFDTALRNPLTRNTGAVVWLGLASSFLVYSVFLIVGRNRKDRF
jgi:hypothetical protein